MRRAGPAYSYVALLGLLVAFVNLTSLQSDAKHPDSALEVVYLCVAAALLNIPQARIEQGRLTLGSIASVAAALLLNPLDATVVGLASSVPHLRRGPYPILGNAVFAATVNSVGAIVAAGFRDGNTLPLAPRLLVLTTCAAVEIAVVVLSFRIALGQSVRSVAAKAFTPSFFVAYGYVGLASLLISYLIDGSTLGYFLATIVCVLALALTDTIAGRRVRRVLETELSDADRHLFHSRAVEGVVHNLRNHVATAVGYLKEIEAHRLDPVDREAIEMATSAANDAVTVLRGLSQGATPKVSYALEPIDLNELATRALGMARPRAKFKEVQLGIREAPDEVKVKADPLLLREVITNLVNNAVDAAPTNGHVELRTGRRSNGWPYLSVVDNGPGVSDENRHHLFEPHFTTKEGGTGLGLFMSYGIVKEHQGQLLYEGSRRGAVFTVALPPFNS
jgi:signal transduction histidine kinase